MLDIYVDADACPVRQEVAKVAKRYRLRVVYVSNSYMRIPADGQTELVVVEGNFDAADNWIVEHISANDIVATVDIPLAHRSIKAGAQVLGFTGRPFSDENIGQLMATRDLMSELREAGTITGGPAPFQPQDRSRFLQGLDQVIQKIRRETPPLTQ